LFVLLVENEVTGLLTVSLFFAVQWLVIHRLVLTGSVLAVHRSWETTRTTNAKHPILSVNVKALFKNATALLKLHSPAQSVLLHDTGWPKKTTHKNFIKSYKDPVNFMHFAGFNFLTTARANILARNFLAMYRQPLELESCSNPLRLQHVF